MDRALTGTVNRPIATNDARLPPRYRVEHRIAVGGMATVWAAEDQLLGRVVAVKVLAEHLAQQERFVERFQREAKTAARLSGHPHVITIHDVGEHDGRPFIVMEYLPGGTVRDRLADASPPSRDDVLEWLEQAASALDFAHERGVVHRDVKPQNLLLDGRDRLVVADFGIARPAYEDRLTATGEVLGTATYISPEQATGDDVTAASDRYSLGVVAYELLTGGAPFEAHDFASQARMHLEQAPDPPSSHSGTLPGSVDPVMLRMLSKRPRDRWSTATDFVRALQAAFAAVAGSARVWPAADELAHRYGTAPGLVSAEPARRRRGLAAPLLVALAAIVAGVLVATTLLDKGGDNGSRQRQTSGNPPQRPAARPKKNSRAAPARSVSRARRPPATPTAGTTETPAAVAPAGGRSSAVTSAAALNDQGFRLMNAGRYQEAIPPLQRAVASFPAGSTDLTYAYALFNLGRTLRLAGRPAEAIPILQRRLGIPNQRDAVARELAAARQAAH